MHEWAATERHPAEIVLADGATLRGMLHLQPRVAHRHGPETVLELLNREDAFFVLSLADGDVALVSKAQVVSVSCGPETADDAPGAVRLVALVVVLHGGEEHRGRVSVELPPTRARALDFVNAPGRFFALHTDAAIHYFNRSYVRIVRPFD